MGEREVESTCTLLLSRTYGKLRVPFSYAHARDRLTTNQRVTPYPRIDFLQYRGGKSVFDTISCGEYLQPGEGKTGISTIQRG